MYKAGINFPTQLLLQTNISVHVSRVHIPQNGISGSFLHVYLTLEETAKQFSKVVVAFTLHPVLNDSLHAASCLFVLFSALLSFKKFPFPSQLVVFSKCHVFLHSKGAGHFLNFSSGS